MQATRIKGSRWTDLRQFLQEHLDAEEFLTWFGPLRVRSEDRRRLVLKAPNEHFVHTIEQSYRPAIDAWLESVDGQGPEILFDVELSEPPPPPPESLTEFDPRYTFESFVVGNSNEFAHAAALAVGERPSPVRSAAARQQSYNPLFIYGGVGLGKTHLMHAIAAKIRERHPGLQILYTTAEQFVNELINSIRFERMPAFRDRYRTIDVLLIDDIQFIANKERTQEEFFHTFNTLYTAQKQIIVSSDSSPRQIPTLEERLRSRFEWGLLTDIQAPELETKVAILRRKAENDSIELPDDVALFIADQVKSNIRELEGLLNRVAGYASLTGRDITLDFAKDALRDVLPPEGQRVTASDIIKHVARHYGLRVSEIKSKNNSKHVAFPRQVAMYLCKRLTPLSYPDIGKNFNDKHHSTVMYSVDKIEQLRAKEVDINRQIQSFLAHFG